MGILGRQGGLWNGQKYKHFATHNRCIIHGGNNKFDG